jgi:small-conductance mechanosensitive channel
MGILLEESVGPGSFLEAEDKVTYLVDLIRPVISKILVAVIVLLVGFIVGKLAGKTLQWLLRALELNRRCRELLGLQWRVEQFLSGLLAGAIYFIVIIMALTVLGLSKIIALLLSVSVIVLIVSTILLSIKDFVPNYVDGFRLRKRLHEGDTVVIDETTGNIKEMTWTDVKIVAQTGDVLYIPNSLFLKKGFKKVR